MFFYDENPMVAYWAGFLMADGTIINEQGKSPSLRLRVAHQDLSHLVAFQMAIGAVTHELTETYLVTPDTGEKTSRGWTIKMSSPHLGTSLVRWGIIPDKTHLGEIPPIPSPLIPHYIRGLIDGDGWVSATPDANRMTIGFCGNRSVVEFVRTAMASVIDAKLTINIGTTNPEDGHETWTLQVRAQQQVVKVARWLYDTDGPCLSRKRDKAIIFLTNVLPDEL